MNAHEKEAEDEERMKIITSANRGSNSGAISNSAAEESKSNVSQELSANFKESNDNAYENKAFKTSETNVSRVDPISFESTMNGNLNSEEYLALNHGSSQSHDRQIYVQRKPADFNYMERKYGLLPPRRLSNKVSQLLKSNCICSFSCFMSFITSVFPVLKWLPNYKLGFLVLDLISGFTISILHIPQGMAYGILASLKPENGLYVSFFPVLIYFLLGTSRHVSIGTFAVISLMISSTIDNIHGVHINNYNATKSNVTSSPDIEENNLLPTSLEIATALAIGVGLWQLVLGISRMGALSVILSDQLVSGFTTGAATHVAISQLTDLFGISIKRRSGILKLVYALKDIFQELSKANGATIIISAISIFTIASVKEQINDRFKNKLKMPIPVDLIVVIIATLISYLANFEKHYDVVIMSDIPVGLPSPQPPNTSLIIPLLLDSFIIAIVAFTISLSMAKLFAKKHKYEINPNQELIALGCANIFSSFFSCYPCSASLSRSLVQERAGGQTQVTGLISCGILLLVLLVLAPMFYYLPKCILSCIILVALKGMFLQVKDFTKAWKISKIDSLIWLVTFLSTVLLDISYGLLVGVIFSIATVAARTILPSRSFLGNISGTDLYLDVERYQEAKEIDGIKIFHFESALYFMNKELFKNILVHNVPLTQPSNENGLKNGPYLVKYIVIDCSSFSYVDMSGLEMLLEIMKEYAAVGVSIYLSGCSVAMCDMMERAQFFEHNLKQPFIFATVHDAIQYCTE